MSTFARRATAIALAALALAGVGTEPLAAQPQPTVAGAARPVRVFLDCAWFCDFDYLRAETSWVDFVRDRADADVHILVTRQGTGAGGAEYLINLVGQRPAAYTDTLRFTSLPGVADDVVRQGLTRTIQLGLVPYVVRTPQAAGLRLSYDAEGGAVTASAPGADPWNAWVYRVSAGGSFEREAQQNEVDLNGSFSARRITERWKLGISGNGNFSRDQFDLVEEEETIQVTTTRESFSTGVVGIRSLGAHWGVGAQASVGSSTFSNTQLSVRAAPAVEYSLFPYSESTRRALVVQYSVGVSSFQYREQTIFDRMEETRPTQALVVGYDVRQAWGSINAELEAANYLDDGSQHRVEFDGFLNFRLVRGLELNLGGSASLIRDQLSLVKRDATPEEILLRQRALRTNYRYSGHVGLAYTFGSIFNSVVNPRFGSGPGQILR